MPLQEISWKFLERGAGRSRFPRDYKKVLPANSSPPHNGTEMPPSLRILQKCQAMSRPIIPGSKKTCHA